VVKNFGVGGSKKEREDLRHSCRKASGSNGRFVDFGGVSDQGVAKVKTKGKRTVHPFYKGRVDLE